MSNRICAIDIGSFSVKVARVEVGSQGISVYGYQEYPRSLDPARDKQIELIEILRQVRSVESEASLKFVVGIKQSEVSCRLKGFPFREKVKILRATPFEVEDDIPLNQDEAIFDAKIVRYRGGAADALCMAVSKETLGGLLRSVREGGVDPHIVSCEASAYANTVESWMALPPQMEASEEFQSDMDSPELTSSGNADVYLHLGHESSLMTVFQGKRIVATRSLGWGGTRLIEAISRKMQVPPTEAARLLATKGTIPLSGSKDGSGLGAVLTEALRALVLELRLSLLEVKTELNVHLDQVHISGGVAQLPNLGMFLSQNLEVACNTFNHLERYSNLYIDQTGSVPFSSTLAVGLAIEGAKRPRNPAINFRKGEYAVAGDTWASTWNIWRKTAQVAAAGLVAFYVYAYFREDFARSASYQAEVTLKDQAQTLAGLKGARASESAIRKLIAEKDREAKVREMLQDVKNVSSALDTLKRFSELIPSRTNVQMDIKSWQLVKDQLTVEGLVAAPAQVNLVRQSLVSLSVDNKVQATNTNVAATAGKTPFGFRLRVARQEGR